VRALCVAALLAAATPGPVAAQDLAQLGTCRLALAFALDVSASVNPAEYRLQLDGLAEALGDPAVREAILGPGDPVAFAAYEWSGTRQQVMVAPWSMIANDADLDAFADKVRTHDRFYGEFPTAVGYALGYGAVLLRDAPPCLRRVIDISGDGVSNDGFGPELAYRHFDFASVTVNGLVVGDGDAEVIDFYRRSIAHGPEAFVEIARNYADYGRAMRRKLLREIGADYLSRR